MLWPCLTPFTLLERLELAPKSVLKVVGLWRGVSVGVWEEGEEGGGGKEATHYLCLC